MEMKKLKMQTYTMTEIGDFLTAFDININIFLVKHQECGGISDFQKMPIISITLFLLILGIMPIYLCMSLVPKL
jgi:hypothetical protein